MEYNETAVGITRIGNYLVSQVNEKQYSLTPVGKQNECWLTGEILCSKEDAERIAMVFTSQDILTIAIRQTMIRKLKKLENAQNKGE